MSAQTLHPDRILQDLHGLWADLGREKEDAGESAVLRACAMTLIILTDASEDPRGLAEVLAEVMPELPSRTIIVRLRASRQREVTSRVYAQCWLPFSGRRQICCEQVEIEASDEGMEDLHSLLLALIVPDLPAAIWCRSARLVAMSDFRHVAAIAGKLIVDGAMFGSGKEGIAAVGSSVHPVIGDLAWTRLTPWRQVIARVFDNQDYLDELHRVSVVRAFYFGSEPAASALYLAAWLAAGIAEAGGNPHIKWTPEQGEGGVGLLGLEARGPALDFALDFRSGELRVNNSTFTIACPMPPDDAALLEELSITGHDSVFSKTLVTAMKLASSHHGR